VALAAEEVKGKEVHRVQAGAQERVRRPKLTTSTLRL